MWRWAERLLPKLPPAPAFNLSLCILRQQRAQPLQYSSLGHHTGAAVDHFPILKVQNRGQAADLILLDQFLILFGIELDEAGVVTGFFSGGSKIGGQGMAGATPIRPDINDNGRFGIQDQRAEGFTVDLSWHNRSTFWAKVKGPEKSFSDKCHFGF